VAETQFVGLQKLGGSVLIKCSTCGSRVSRRWLLLGLPWSKYRCVQCGSVFAATTLRFVLTSVAVGIVGYVLIRVVKGMMSPVLLIPAVGLTLLLLLVSSPWQIRKVGEAARSNDTRRE
jgi:DNA-directed RNA polymerase subunit RPC12/RpoP